MKSLKLFIVSILISTIFISTAEAAKESFDRTKKDVKQKVKEKGHGMASGKRQHNPMKEAEKVKSQEYNSSRPNRDTSKAKPNEVKELKQKLKDKKEQEKKKRRYEHEK